MVIIGQNREIIVNLDNVIEISVESDTIYAFSDMRHIVLAQYEEDERAGEVMNDILKTLFPRDCNYNNDIVYYMPEE